MLKLENEAISGYLKMGFEPMPVVAHKAKEIAINCSFGTVVIEIFHELGFIDSGTPIIAKLPLGVPNPPHVNVILSLNPALLVMVACHMCHVVDGVHIVRGWDVTVHHVVG